MLRRALLSPPVFISLIVVLVASTLPLYVSGYVLGLLTIAYYFGVFSMAWDLLFGFANEVNFGPSFLIGLGAYTAGILDNLYQPPILLSVAAGVLAAMTGGVVLALPALRVRGPYFGLTTLVAVLMLQNFVVVAASLTGGEIGLTVPDVISIDDKVNYWIALGFMAVSSAILYGLSRSPVGLILQASGQDPVQAAALGFNVTKHKLAAFLVSAFFSGLAGALMVFYLGAASVGTFPDRDVDEGSDRGRPEIEDHQSARESGEKRADQERRQLVLGHVEPERCGLHRVLAARLQDETDRRARKPVQDSAAHGHEAERDPVIDLVVDRNDVRHSQADFPASQTRRHDDEVLQHEHRDEGGEAEIGPAHPQRRQGQHDAAGHRRKHACRDAEQDRRLIEIVEYASGVSAEPDQERGAEVHFVGKAEQEVPGHREHAEIIGDGEQAQHVAGDIERQRRSDEDDDQADEDRRGEKRAAQHDLAPAHQSARPHVHHRDEQQERRDRAIGRRNEIGGERLEIAHNIGGDQRARNAAEAAQHDDRERARGQRACAIGGDAEKHAEQHAGDARKSAINRPDADINGGELDAEQGDAARIH